MFAKEIYGLTLTNDLADGIFPNINGVAYRNDTSFVATLRALLHSRVPKEESVYLEKQESAYNAENLSKKHKTNIDAFMHGSKIAAGMSGILRIQSFRGNQEGNDAVFKLLDEKGLGESYPEYRQLEDLARFFEQKKIRVRFFINEQQKNTIIFVENLDIRKWHLLQSLITRYFPWYFAENPATEFEIKIIKSLTTRYEPEYKKLMEEISSKFDFRTMKIRKELHGFEVRFEKDKLRNVEDQINRQRTELDNLNRRFRDIYQQIQDLTTTQLGLIAKINRGVGDDEDSELLEYFLCNKNLHLIRIDGSMMEFVVARTVADFDPDVFDSAINNPNSFFYRHYSTGERYENKEMTDERIKKLMLAIFEEGLLKLRLCAGYKLGFADGYYSGLRGYDFPESILSTHTPNQHIQHYACLGNNDQLIREAMVKRDYVGALVACCSSAGNMNFTESNVGTFHMEKICANDVGAIIEMPDGSTMTPVEACKWLEAQEGVTE